jgi:hypothetical protein
MNTENPSPQTSPNNGAGPAKPGPIPQLQDKLQGFGEALTRAETAVQNLSAHQGGTPAGALLVSVLHALQEAHAKVAVAHDALGTLPPEWRPAKAARKPGSLVSGEPMLLRPKSASQYAGLVEASDVLAVMSVLPNGRVKVATPNGEVLLVPRGHLMHRPAGQ